MSERPPITTATIPFAPHKTRLLAEVEAEMARQARPAAEDDGPTDAQYVANSINELRYLDLKRVADGILGTEKRDGMTAATLADLMAEWAEANKRARP